jgi:hypothetical protein
MIKKFGCYRARWNLLTDQNTPDTREHQYEIWSKKQLGDDTQLRASITYHTQSSRYDQHMDYEKLELHKQLKKLIYSENQNLSYSSEIQNRFARSYFKESKGDEESMELLHNLVKNGIADWQTQLIYANALQHSLAGYREYGYENADSIPEDAQNIIKTNNLIKSIGLYKKIINDENCDLDLIKKAYISVVKIYSDPQFNYHSYFTALYYSYLTENKLGINKTPLFKKYIIKTDSKTGQEKRTTFDIIVCENLEINSEDKQQHLIDSFLVKRKMFLMSLQKNRPVFNIHELFLFNHFFKPDNIYLPEQTNKQTLTLTSEQSKECTLEALKNVFEAEHTVLLIADKP